MKKFLAMILAVAMLATLAACGSQTPSSAPQGGSSETPPPAASSPESVSAPAPSSEPQTLTLILRGGSYADVIKAALPEFEAANNVKCEVLDLAFDDLHNKIALDALNPKGAYDLCMVDGSWMAEFTAHNVLANLSALGYSFDNDIIPNTTSICEVDGQIYLAPYFGNVTIMLYNKENVKNAGVDIAGVDSWEEIMTACKAAAAQGKKGFLLRGDTPDNFVSDFLPLLLAYKGWVIDKDNKPTVNTPEFKEAMNFYLELIATGEAQSKDDVVAALDSGAATMGVGWPGWYVPADDKAASYIMIPPSAKQGGEKYATSEYGIWTIGIPQNSEKKELSMKLLQYIMSPEVQLASIDNGGVPCRFSCLQNKDVLAKYPHLEIVCSALQSGVYRPVIEQWNDFTTTLGTEMDNIIQGTKSIDQGLKDAQSQLEAMMA
mgnify:FL=1